MKKTICTALLLCLFPSLAQAEGYYYHYDHLGGVDTVTDEEGEVVAEYEYYPFGEVYEETIYDENFSNSYKYTGQEEDEETNLYYYNARYYGAGFGRFMSQDPAVYDERIFEMLEDPQSLNAYTYVRNNPVKYVDPSGENLALFLVSLYAAFEIWDNTMANNLWGYGVSWLSKNGCSIAAMTLNHSLNGEGGHISFNENSNVGYAIRNSEEYQEVTNNIIGSIQGGQMDGYGSFAYTENGSNQDLFYAFAKMGYSYSAGYEGEGVYTVSITLIDIYNFDKLMTNYENGKAVWANNAGFFSEAAGYLDEYGITININETFEIENSVGESMYSY